MNRKRIKARWPATYYRCGRKGEATAEVKAYAMRACGWLTADRRAWAVRRWYVKADTEFPFRFPGRATDDIWLVYRTVEVVGRDWRGGPT
jgi:hypothetical protein